MTKWLALSAVILVVDQLTKFAIASSLTRVVEVTPFFNLALVHNPGAAFSFLSDASGWQRGLFIVIGLAASVWIVYLLRKHPRQTLFCWALSLVLAGAVGNVIDRILFGAVIDFLDFHAFGRHWPAFNVADAAITCGAALLIWDGFRPRKTKTLEPQINADKRR
ncbi:MAG: signal peptidase II [Betaproteobacteria bacterium RIFCSPLOWO2_12_FULL_62_58]|nr:MAG: signal peptidase II [Betaproteobacteria bacterium RIFCSPLOWO2_12_FULL_62_58]